MALVIPTSPITGPPGPRVSLPLETRNRNAAALLADWMAEPDDYDEAVWPILEAELKSDPLRLNRVDDQPRS